MPDFKFVEVDLNKKHHAHAFVKLMNAYMEDPMGKSESISEDLAEQIIKDLKVHPTYLGVMVEKDGQFVALANCFRNYSTFKAQSLINIHDFIVMPECRNQGAGMFLLKSIEKIGKERSCCRINLEVRNDNKAAMQLYQKAGFRECNPPMYFWEQIID